MQTDLLEKQMFLVSTIFLIHVSTLSGNGLPEWVMKSKENKLHRVCSKQGRTGKFIDNCGGESERKIPQRGTIKLKQMSARGSNPGRVNRFSLLQNVQTGSGVHPPSYSMGTRVLARG
jgi:hypothetical protein